MRFWGPNIRAAMAYAYSHDVPEGLSPYEFGRRMDALAGTEPQGHNSPERAAYNWLTALGIDPPNKMDAVR